MKTALLLPVVLAVACLAGPAPLAARDIYVNNVTGSPEYDGGAATPDEVSGPVHSLEHALKIARKGDRIIMADTGVPYYESVSLQTAEHCGRPGVPFVIDGGGAILDGSRPVPPQFWRHYAGKIYYLPLRRRGPYQMLFLAGKPLPRVKFSEDEATKLPPLHWGYFNGNIYLRLEDGKMPEDYELAVAWHPVGITLYHVHDVVISNLTVQGFQLDGINAHDKVDQSILGGLVCRGNGRSGITIAGASQVIIEGCLLGDNGAAQLRVEGPSTVEVLETDLLSNTAPPVEQRGGRLNIKPKSTAEGDAPGDATPMEPNGNEPAGDDNAADASAAFN